MFKLLSMQNCWLQVVLVGKVSASLHQAATSFDINLYFLIFSRCSVMILQCYHCFAIKSSAFSFDVAVKYLNTIVNKYPVSLQVDGTYKLHFV